MQMNRTRERTDRFVLRGWTIPFHELADQGRMAALVADTDEIQWLRLKAWKEPIEIRPGDLEIIFPQIGWPMPGKRRAAAEAPASATLASALAATEAATEAVGRLKAAADAPPLPVSTVENGTPSRALQALIMPNEKIKDAITRLTPALGLEFDEVNNLVQIPGGGGRVLESGKTAEARHRELTALLDELAALGAQAERA
jgi:hypothetical protein